MEDRFKVRAFDISDNCYVKIVHLDFDTNGNFLQMRFIKPKSIDPDGFEYVCDRDQLDKIIFEQCTGLKDRNGKLIYEGDIVLLSDNNKNYQVFFDEETGQFKAKIPSYEVLNFEIYQPSSSLFTVVGNIHENPELMEGK